MKRIFIFLLLTLFSVQFYAQKELITEKDLIVERATKELNEMMANAESDLVKFASENKIKGEYIFDITIHGKGQVLTVFMVSSDASDVKTQNMVKDKIRTLHFNFKMPKDKSYKFQYTFDFK